MRNRVALLLVPLALALAHDPAHAPITPTAATRELLTAARDLNAAKRKLTVQGGGH